MEVYLFGAGASAAEGAPATRDLFPRAWELLGQGTDPRVEAVWRFLHAVFGVEIRSPASFRVLPTVDEVISLVDWSLQTHQGLGHAYDPPRLYQIRRDLEHLVRATLQAAIQPAASRGGGPHARFVRRLIAQGLVGSTALISLNYDTLLDNALTRTGLILDYGLGAGAGGPRFRDRGTHAGESGPSLLLAKLHGSLNWAFCPACGRVAAASPRIGNRRPDSERLRCDRCLNPNLRGLIISPTLHKSYPAVGLLQVWDQALEAIQRAGRITFVGYSMPPADLPVYHLIRRGLLTRRHSTPPEIRVINHQRAEWTAAQRRLRRNALTQRFCRLFGPAVTFDFSGFHGQI